MRSIPAALAVASALALAWAAIADFAEARPVEPSPLRIIGSGFVTDGSHPQKPGDFRRHEIDFQLTVDPRLGEAGFSLESGESDAREIDRYYVRRGRIFQVDTAGVEIDPASFVDLSAATIAALHPMVVMSAIRERPGNLREISEGRAVFAWRDELWEIDSKEPLREGGAIARLRRSTFDDLLGDGEEEVRYEGVMVSGRFTGPAGVVVTARGREIARFSFSAVEIGEEIAAEIEFPSGNRDRDRARVADPDELVLHEIAPHCFEIDVISMDTRVFVIEFTDHLVVLEGVYNSRNCDRIAQRVSIELGKPVRYFSFSHLHGQYIGGLRSWVHAGATVLTPPTTVPLVEEIFAAGHELRPDALSREPKPLRFETIADRRLFEDETNALEILQVESQHTDEYFLFYLPRAKLLMTGDLLFYRPGNPLRGRSKKLCETVAELGLDVETYYATWPLSTEYGTKSIVTREEMRKGCAE